MAIETIIVVLGNTNDAEGQLSPTAVSRLDTALGCFRSLSAGEKDNTRFVTTGGFGSFNPSRVPHGELMNRYLIAGGVPESALLPFINSNGTIDDGIGVARLLAGMTPAERRVVLVTSAFHMRRASTIFRRLMPDVQLVTVPDRNWGTAEQRMHEERAMGNLDRELPVAENARHPTDDSPGRK